MRDRRRELADVPQHLPAARHGQPHRVLLAQVVGVRLGVAGQRADDGGQVGVGVGQGRDRRAGTPGPGAPAHHSHRDTQSADHVRTIAPGAAIGPDSPALCDPPCRRRLAPCVSPRRHPRRPRTGRRGAAGAVAIAAAAGCAASSRRGRCRGSAPAASSSTTSSSTRSRSSRGAGRPSSPGVEFAVEDVPALTPGASRGVRPRGDRRPRRAARPAAARRRAGHRRRR